jgi:hypothetical protein
MSLNPIIQILILSAICLIWAYPKKKENKTWGNFVLYGFFVVCILYFNYHVIMLETFSMTTYCYAYTTLSSSKGGESAAYKFVYNKKVYFGSSKTTMNWDDKKNLNKYYKVKFCYKDLNVSSAYLEYSIPRDSVPIEYRELLEK